METKRVTVPQAEEILGLYHPVLDHGYIALTDYMGGDDLIEANARVSYQGGTRKVSDTRHLIRYLVAHAHGTPLEVVTFRFHVKCPIFVMRQWIRHRISSFSEMSGRYSVIDCEFYTPDAGDFALQSTDNKQGRGDLASNALYNDAANRWELGRDWQEETYSGLIEDGVARELARLDLPLSTYTEFIWTVNLRSLFNFLTLRTDSHAQLEIRKYANVIAGMVERVCPLAFEAWVDYEAAGQRFSHQEMQVLRYLVEAYTESDGSAMIAGNTAAVGSRGLETSFGLSKREVGELVAKLQPQERPSFPLDLTKVTTP